MLGFALAKFRGDSLKLLPHGCVVNVEIAETGGNGNLADAFSGPMVAGIGQDYLNPPADLSPEEAEAYLDLIAGRAESVGLVREAARQAGIAPASVLGSAGSPVGPGNNRNRRRVLTRLVLALRDRFARATRPLVERTQSLFGWLTGFKRDITTAHGAETERTVSESVLVVCESAVMYRRRMLGQVSVAAIADLVLFDEENPRSLAFQFERLRADLRALPSSTGSTRPERMIDEIAARLRRQDPADLEHVTDDGRRDELAELLDGMHTDLRELSELIRAAHLALPSGMQPLWGPDERRQMP